ncbi:MAG TPA: amino acid permease [Pirellulales bacterium]|nr:amino acid permease [Pirellulales bacterium]
MTQQAGPKGRFATEIQRPSGMANQLFAKKTLDSLAHEMAGEHRLRRVLGPVALSALGVGAIIGTGIFVLVGVAAHDKTGPALMLSFVVAGAACVFAALCYAEFASMAPVAGSAYTYAYITLGELFAWIIGWDLILEYAVAASTVAHGWSKYFQALVKLFHHEIPKRFGDAPFDYGADGIIAQTGAWFDAPALAISLLITAILVIGIRESAGFNAAMVIVKVGVVLFVIAVGAWYINPENWHPFAPYGYTGLSFFGYSLDGHVDDAGKPVGMLAGAAVIFFAYIGFDAVSTQAEEARNPQRDVPIAIIASLAICTILYIAVAAVVTGMVKYSELDIDAPVADAFKQIDLGWAELLITIGALTGITSVLLVMMLSQPRVFLAMARDGLLPASFFAAVHSRFQTPWKSTLLTGAIVGAMASLLPLRVLAELTNIGTLLAFVIVCAAVLIMRHIDPDAPRPFRAPLVPLVPILGILFCLILMFSLPWENWVRLAVWLFAGLVIYFGYGRFHSRLGKQLRHEIASHGVSPAGSPGDEP